MQIQSLEKFMSYIKNCYVYMVEIKVTFILFNFILSLVVNYLSLIHFIYIISKKEKLCSFKISLFICNKLEM